MASSKPIPCGPCYNAKVNTQAELWCYDCEEGLCSTCSGHHKISKSSRDHKTINIKSYKLSNKAIKTECDKHGQQLNLYCPSHLMPCCDECILTRHSKCSGITSLASVVEETKMEKSKESSDKDINSILDILNKIMVNKLENINRGEQQYDSIKGRIAEVRKKMNHHLDKLEKKLCKETETILSKEKLNASDLINEIEEKRGTLDGMKDYLHEVTTHSSTLQSFLGVHQIEQQVHQCQRYVDNLEDDERTKEFDINMEQNYEIEESLKKLESIESLGEVTVVKTISMNRETSVRREAQVQSREQSDINNMTMTIEKKIQISIGNWIRDMLCLIDGRVIIVKQFGTVNLLTSDGEIRKQLPIPGEAWSVTQINQNTFAITYPKEKVIKIFDMENETVAKVFKLDKQCYGLSFSNNSLAVGLTCWNNAEIRIIDLQGNTLKSIHVQSESTLLHMVYCYDRVIYSDYQGKAVYCVDGSGKQIWQYTQGLSEPEGLCIDTYGNTIVADGGSDRIIVISKDGQDSKVLINNHDELQLPQCICFSKHTESSGVISDYLGTYLANFNLSYK
ncbi:Hypothetical predicted protein [Mytilus galloprovincialis]|uniref:B box-type domain-containing protein n=1 Tax=Mytilus galloprovincialis TaxID=29158 RepID=A0A8B6G9I4_MYTGA|nr:Hypothetical predicted protein [Mytilus galloprovincialis]